MSKRIRLIVGLGNPGQEYERTRHNAGFWFVEALARRYRLPLQADTKHFGLTSRWQSDQQDIRLLMPTTFMNRSGQAVASLAQFYKMTPEEILVVHDELDLPVGVARFKQGGGHGGHNGLKDIIQRLGQNNQFHRLRLGIDHPGHSSQVVGYVLGKTPQAEQQKIEDIIDTSIDALEYALQGNWDKAKQFLHSHR